MGGLKRFRQGVRRAVVELSAFSIVVNLALLVMPLYMLQVYDRVLTSGSSDTLTFLSIIAVAALVLLGLLEAVRGIYATRLGTRLEASVGRDALVATLGGPRAGLGDVQVLRDMQQVRGFLSNRQVFALFDVPFAPLFILILWLVHPALFWLTVVGAAVLAVIAVLNQRATARANEKGGEAASAANLAAQSFARSRESLVAMGMIDHVVGAWGEREAEALQAQDRAARVNSWFTGLSRTVRMGLQIAVLGYGAYLVLGGQMTAGMIFAASIISGRALQPIDQVIGGWKGFVDVNAAWKRLRAAIEPFEREREPTEQAEPKGRIDVENAVFTVPAPGAANGARAIIKRVSARIQPGEAVGVIGMSGAGKSTLLKLIVGALRPTSGAVRLDGADLANWPPAQRGRQFGYLAQEVELLPGTVKQNIARFDPAADDADVRLAAERAGVTALVQGLPMGFDTPIGPGGHQLSGGERQRIGLARAFYRMPRVLVLDEPNASLDEAGRAALEAALGAAKEAGTTVIVAVQRREILTSLDKVLVMEAGEIAKFDTVERVRAWMQERAAAAAGGNVSPINAPNTGAPRRSPAKAGPSTNAPRGDGSPKLGGAMRNGAVRNGALRAEAAPLKRTGTDDRATAAPSEELLKRLSGGSGEVGARFVGATRVGRSRPGEGGGKGEGE